MASKIVLIGHVDGQLSTVFTKLAKLHAKQNFAFAIIAGNLFAEPDRATDADLEDLTNLLDGSIEVPLPTYFALGKRPLPESIVEKLSSNDGEACANLSILGRNVSIKTSEGIRIVALGGAFTGQEDRTLTEYEPFHSDKHIALAKEYKETDILITADWPANLRDGSRLAINYEGELPAGDQGIAELCAALKPRYHFSASDAYFEREPFFHVGTDPPRPITRFISLAPHGNPTKQKWISAFNIEPGAAPPQELPVGCTASPFKAAKKRKLASQEESFNGFRYSNGNGNASSAGDSYRPGGGRNNHGHKGKKPRTALPQQCYFCLSREDAETHMITSIGNESYLTIAKGPLTTGSNFPSLNHPSHILIIPFQHSPTVRSLPEAALTEMKRYREALHTMLSTKSTTDATGEAALGAVTWMISRASGVHIHWQFLPIPVEMVKRSMVEVAFDVEAENLGYGSFAKSEAEQAEAEEGDFFKVMIWSEGSEKVMVLPLSAEMRFDLQFGRVVMGKLLGLESRRHWKDCAQSTEEESHDAEAFKGLFEAFDFSLTE